MLGNIHENFSEFFFTNTDKLRMEQVKHRANCNSFCHISSFKNILADLGCSDWLNNTNVITMLFPITQSDFEFSFKIYANKKCLFLAINMTKWDVYEVDKYSIFNCDVFFSCPFPTIWKSTKLYFYLTYLALFYSNFINFI